MKHIKNASDHDIPLVHIEAEHLDCFVDATDIAYVCTLARNKLFVPSRRSVLKEGLY